MLVRQKQSKISFFQVYGIMTNLSTCKLLLMNSEVIYVEHAYFIFLYYLMIVTLLLSGCLCRISSLFLIDFQCGSIILMKLVLIAVLLVVALCSKRPQPVNIASISKVYSKPWYSGYLDVNNNLSHMHYFFFPSQGDSTKDPILFWFNGGPGCSSLLGAMYEHGPFLINDNFGSIIYNQYSWNQKANVVYIESPAQVGFSYTDGVAPTWNDDLVAKLNAKAVREFFNVWTEFAGRETYISGQSYAGIYVPTLFYELHSTNDQDPVKVNLKGFAVGNGCTDPLECEFQNDYGPFLIQLFRDYGYITQEKYEEVDIKCKDQGAVLSEECNNTLNEVYSLVDGYNIYDAYRPCYQNQEGLGKRRLSLLEIKRRALRKKESPNDKLGFAPPCVDSLAIDKFLTDRDNRKALGIPETVMDYSMCNDNEDFGYDRSLTGSYWVYQRLVPLNRYKIVIYSGDSDPAVPYSGTIFWVNKLRQELKLPTQEYWRPWYTTNNANGKQNSGNVWTLANNFRLVTFKGVGHMAPQWNNEGGYRMINSLINGEQI